MLPDGVERKTIRKSSGKVYTYYYWNPGRGTDREGERILLPSADTKPEAFWAEVERRRTSEPTAYPAGSIGDLVARYRKSDEFKRLSDGTRTNYEVHMRRFEAHYTWGIVAVRDLTPLAVQTARDAMKETPVLANQMLSVGRTVWDWAIPINLATLNPFDKIKDFDIPDRGHVPWPSWVVDYVRQHAWPDLVRMMRLGIMTCQRGSDMIRMGPEHRDSNGIWCRPKKTRKRRRLPYPARHGRRARARPLGRDGSHIHEHAVAEADRPTPQRSVPLFAKGRAIHARRSPRALGPMACRYRGGQGHLPSLEGMGRRPGQEIRVGHRPRRRRPSDHPRPAWYRHPGARRAGLRGRPDRQRHRHVAP